MMHNDVNLVCFAAFNMYSIIGLSDDKSFWLLQGRRFLGFIMTLDGALTDCLHKCIKNHIPTAPR